MTDSTVAKVTISLPSDLLTSVDAVAEKSKLSRSALIGQMLSASVKRAAIDGPPGMVALRDALAQCEEHGCHKAAIILRMAVTRQEAST